MDKCVFFKKEKVRVVHNERKNDWISTSKFRSRLNSSISLLVNHLCCTKAHLHTCDPMANSFEYELMKEFASGEWVKKDEYLIGNGAYLFRELVKSTHGKNNPFRIFSLKELQKATNNFSEDLTLYDFVITDSCRSYRGIIEDRHVAVKAHSECYTLVNEVVSLSLIKHRNAVKLLGCCLETKFPIVVHELPPNGTLGENIFHENHLPPRVELLWTDRLRIATEIADAVAYLHSELHMTHGRLQAPEAILLDKFHSAKLGAFHHSKIQKRTKSTDVETYIRNKFRKRNDVSDFGNILLNLLCIDFGKVKRYDKVEILKYLKLNFSEKDKPQIEAYIDLLLRCRSSNEEQWNILLSVNQYYARMEEEDELSIEEVVRELRRIRSLDSSSDLLYGV